MGYVSNSLVKFKHATPNPTNGPGWFFAELISPSS